MSPGSPLSPNSQQFQPLGGVLPGNQTSPSVHLDAQSPLGKGQAGQGRLDGRLEALVARLGLVIPVPAKYLYRPLPFVTHMRLSLFSLFQTDLRPLFLREEIDIVALSLMSEQELVNLGIPPDAARRLADAMCDMLWQ